jgi:hypothetical protein
MASLSPDPSRRGRLGAAVGEHRAVDVAHDSQVDLVLELLEQARARPDWAERHPLRRVAAPPLRYGVRA